MQEDNDETGRPETENKNSIKRNGKSEKQESHNIGRKSEENVNSFSQSGEEEYGKRKSSFLGCVKRNA